MVDPNRELRSSPQLNLSAIHHHGLAFQCVEAIRRPCVYVKNRWVLSFILCDYLGFADHPEIAEAIRRAVKRWGTSLGTPRILGKESLTQRLEVRLAGLVGQPKAIVFPSTTHVALDVISLFSGPRGVIFLDERAYPISRQGALAAASRGTKVSRFGHNDVEHLEWQVAKWDAKQPKLIVCDGVYASGGDLADLPNIVELGEKHNAFIYVDDAHGIGVLGAPTKDVEAPYGKGGGGVLRHADIPKDRILYVATMSKAFGIPLAFVAGQTELIKSLNKRASSLVHSSPPSIPQVAAALACLRLNERIGDARRHALAELTKEFRRSAASKGIRLPKNSFFPIQTLAFDHPRRAIEIGKILLLRGIWPLIQIRPPDSPTGSVIRFITTALHEMRDMRRAVESLFSTLIRYQKN